MKAVLSTIGKFHSFHLARQLHRHQMLEAIFTGYPLSKLKGEGLPRPLIRSFPWLRTPYMGLCRLNISTGRLDRGLGWWALQTLDAYTAARLPECDVFLALSGVGLKTGRKVQDRGGIYVCDCPSSHRRYRDQVLRGEFARHGRRSLGEYRRIVEKEEEEYARADAITVCSSYAKRSFLEMGVPESKVRVIPLGANLARFHPTARPDTHRFDVLFVGYASLGKGIPYLLEGFASLSHSRKHLRIVGAVQPDMERLIRRYSSRLSITCTGHCPQSQLKELMSRSHVLVLPSVDEGFGMVMAEAMACGCPVIGTTNTGAPDLIDDGVEGYVIPIRDPGAIAERLQWLADDSERQARMSAAALSRMQMMGGWDAYGDAMIRLFDRLKNPERARAFAGADSAAHE